MGQSSGVPFKEVSEVPLNRGIQYTVIVYTSGKRWER